MLKKVKKSVKKSVSSSKDLEEMKRDYARAKSRSEGESGGGSDHWDKLEVGTNLRRILPNPNGQRFYHKALIHYNVGPESATVRCIGTVNEKGYPNFDTPCPICRRFLKEQQEINSKHERGSEKGKELWHKAKDKYCPKQRYYVNVLKKDGDIKVLSYGEMIQEQLLEYYFGDEEIGDFTDVESGRWIKIKRIGADRKTKYKVDIDSDDIAEIENWDSVKDSLHNLDEVVGQVSTKEAIKQLLDGVSYDDDTEADEDSENEETAEEGEVESEEEEKKPIKKPACFGDSDDYNPKDDTCQECKYRVKCKVKASE